jgi:hypothetical protein
MQVFEEQILIDAHKHTQYIISPPHDYACKLFVTEIPGDTEPKLNIFESESMNSKILYLQGWEVNLYCTKIRLLKFLFLSSTIPDSTGNISQTQFMELPTVALLHCVQLSPTIKLFLSRSLKFMEQQTISGE